MDVQKRWSVLLQWHIDILADMEAFKLECRDALKAQAAYKSSITGLQPNLVEDDLPWVMWAPPMQEPQLHWDILPLHSLTTQHIQLDTRGLYVSIALGISPPVCDPRTLHSSIHP